LVYFESFEETLTLLAALAAAGVAFKVFKARLFMCAVIGVVSAAIVAYVTFFEFTLQDGVITYRNRFRETSFPLSWVQKVGMQTFWAGLPGHTFIFVMRSPPAPMNGYFLRTGLVSWPSATDWLEAVNAAIREKKNE
jgi:hypothetical protein